MRDGMIGLGVAAVRLRVAYRRAYDLLCRGQLQGERRGARWYVTTGSVGEVQRRLVRQRQQAERASERATA